MTSLNQKVIKMDISIPYYQDMTRISNSNIGWFMKYGPAYLHSKLSGEIPDENAPQLARGTMIHEFLLQPEEFAKDYVVWDAPTPSSDKEKKFCEELANTIEIEPNLALISAYRAAYKVGNKKDETILPDAIKKSSTLEKYITSLKEHDERIKISPYQMSALGQIKENIKNHKLASKLLVPEYVGTEDELHHEFHINWEYEVPPTINPDGFVRCKSLLDSIHFDFKNQICTIMDLKTTTHIGHFEDSMEQYDYTRQLYYYGLAAKWYIENELKLDISNWKFEFYIIGISTAEPKHEIRVFKFKWIELVYKAYKEVNSSMLDIAWHIATGKWEHRREYYEGDGSETLML